MIEVNVQQGGPEWTSLRLGVVTASQAARIVTATGKLSTARETYMGELLSEYFLGEPYGEFLGNSATDYGHAMEPEAFDFFALQHGDVRKVGFVFTDEARTVGCSPDGMASGAPLELKCVGPAKHLMWVSRDTLPREHFAQVQFQIWVCGADHGWFQAYHPSFPSMILRVDPDERYQDALTKHVPAFINELAAAKDALIAKGFSRA